MTLLYRASDPEELVFRSELDEIAAQRQAKVYYLVGRRSEHAEYLTPAHLGRLVPDVARREVYLCGPPDLVEAVKRSLQILGVPRRRTHSESFEL